MLVPQSALECFTHIRESNLGLSNAKLGDRNWGGVVVADSATPPGRTRIVPKSEEASGSAFTVLVSQIVLYLSAALAFTIHYARSPSPISRAGMAKTRKNRRSPQRGTQSGVTKVNKTKTSKRPRASLARKAKERGSTYSRHLVNLQLHPDSYSKILGLLKTFLEKGANRDYFAAGAQLRTLALSCLAAFGSEIWGDDRANIAEKHKKHGLHFPEDQDR